MNVPGSPEEIVRVAVAAGERRRRTMAVLHRTAAAAPIAAGVIAAIAVLVRLAAWSPMVPVLLWIATASVMAVALVRARRVRVTTEAMAARIDDEARLRGELRSAHWFASHGAGDAWTTFHLRQAAARLAHIDWTATYPREPARRAWVATAVLTAVTFGVPLAVPSIGLRLRPATVAATARSAEAPEALDQLPADVRESLVDAVSAVAAGRIAPDEALAELRQSGAFDSLGDDLQRQIAALLQKAFEEGSAKMFAGVQDGEPVSAAAARWARENLDMILAGEQNDAGTSSEDSAGKQDQAEERNEYTEDGSAGEMGEASDFQASTRVRTQPTGAAESNQPMPMSGSPDASGEAGSAFGGKHGQVRYGSTAAADLAAAFRQEIVAADQNANGSSRPADDRRRTEQGRSAMSYTRAAVQASFDRVRAESPQAVPESRKALLERYFVRPADAAPATPAPETSGPHGGAGRDRETP